MAVTSCAAVILAACVTAADPAPVEVLDERTGNSYASVVRPLIMSRPRTDVAANARDYLTLVAAHVNHAGRIDTYLIAYRWATVDERMARLPDGSQGELRLQAEGRVIPLQPTVDPAALAMLARSPGAPPTTSRVAWVYAIDTATLLFLADADATDLQAELPAELASSPFLLWSDGRAALRAFAEREGG